MVHVVQDVVSARDNRIPIGAYQHGMKVMTSLTGCLPDQTFRSTLAVNTDISTSM